MRKILFALSVCALSAALTSSLAAKALTIPKGLSQSDQEDVVKILGFGTSMKMATNPYPLGGYSGFELGLDLNFINIDQLTRLGCNPGDPGCPNTSHSTEQEFSYLKLTVGKGLYEDVDLFLSFAPSAGEAALSDYGGMIRWSFYQAELLPVHLFTLLSANQVNIKNEFISQNIAVDLMVGINVDDISIYFGGGQIRSKGSFVGGTSGDSTVSPGTPGLNPNTNTSVSTVERFHTVVGASLSFEPLFVSGEINRYEDSVYTAKLGVRF